MKEYSPRDKIDASRMSLVIDFPFYGSIFLRLNVFEDDTCETAWTDGISIGYNVKYLDTLTHKQVIGLFVHECLHVMLKHHLREQAAHKKKHGRWNRACDYALNPMIDRTLGMELHPNWLYNHLYEDDLAENIFERLKDEPGDSLGGLDGTGNPLPGEVRPFPGRGGGKPTPAEIEAAGHEVEQWVRAATFKAQGAGKLGNSEKDVIKSATASTVNWTDDLTFLMEEITKNDYTWQRPNVRYMDGGIYLPSMSGTTTSDMLFYIDTSGSQSTNQLKQIMGEVREVVSSFNVRVIVVYWDTCFKGCEIFDACDVLEPDWELNIGGRGGTNFSTCFEWLEDNLDEYDIDPKGIIFFTDLECNKYPKDPPDMPLIWCQTPDSSGNFEHNYIQYMPEWGKRVLIPIYKGD